MPGIEHHEQQGRFDIHVDGQLCLLDYQLRDGVMIIQHTRVPDAVAGRGIAAALETSRRRGWRVRPVCTYAAAYLARHPEYQDLAA